MQVSTEQFTKSCQIIRREAQKLRVVRGPGPTPIDEWTRTQPSELFFDDIRTAVANADVSDKSEAAAIKRGSAAISHFAVFGRANVTGAGRERCAAFFARLQEQKPDHTIVNDLYDFEPNGLPTHTNTIEGMYTFASYLSQAFQDTNLQKPWITEEGFGEFIEALDVFARAEIDGEVNFEKALEIYDQVMAD